ncbi:MAG: chromosomal replication initiator protein DnaA [Aquificota bacterium]|nr:chromosomal replication initiator protein DnaA [Aquificota bacterium]
MGGMRINTFIDLVKNRDRTLLKILRHLKIAEKDGRIFLTVPDPDKREYVENLIRLKLGDSLAGEVVVVSEEKNRETSPDLHTGLSRRFTFDNFIVGEGNRLAYEVAVAVSENPGSTYNPFFLYGRVGIGKTHLLQAIGNRCLDKGLKVAYRSAPEFSEEVVRYIKEGRISEFRNMYREVDVLLIDDVQFLSGKERTQMELFNLFNHLYMKDSQIVLASDRHPRELKDISDRLISRFEGGVVVEITLDEMTKIEIVRKKLQELKLTVQENIVRLIMESTGPSVREIEGAIKTLKLGGSGALKPKRGRTDLDTVQETVATYFGISREEILGNSRSGRVARARRFAMYLCRKVTGASLIEIARSFGRKDHTTVIHSIRKVEEERRKDRKTDYILSFLERQLRERI